MGNSSAGSSRAASTQNQRGTDVGATNQIQSLAQLLPPGYQNILDIGLGSLFQGMTGTPNLGQLAGMVPLQGTASLTPTQIGDIQKMQGMVKPSSSVQSALSGLQNFQGADLSSPDAAYMTFLGGEGKPSQATQAALKEFQDIQAPEVLQQAALMGGGTSGGALNALANAQEQAIVPFMQQDLANTLSAAQGLSANDLSNAQTRLTALSSLGGLGLQQEGQSLGAAEAALGAAGMQQGNAQQVLNNLFNQQEGAFNFASGLQTTPQQWFQDLIRTVSQTQGSSISNSNATGTTTQQGSQSQPKF
jgi:hypothetical protein